MLLSSVKFSKPFSKALVTFFPSLISIKSLSLLNSLIPTIVTGYVPNLTVKFIISSKLVGFISSSLELYIPYFKIL